MNRKRNITLLLAMLTLIVLCGASVAMAIEESRVIVYEHANYGGVSKEYTTNDPSFVDEGWNDRVSSIKVLGSAKVILYEHTNYGGKSIAFTSSDGDLTNNILYKAGEKYVLAPEESWNDQASSIKVYFPDPSVDKTSLDFGALYNKDRDGAEDINSKANRIREITLSNGRTATQVDLNLEWEITGAPSYVRFLTPTSGTVSPDSSSTISMWLNPTSDVNTSFTLTTNLTDYTIHLSATVYDTPDVSRIAPSLGTNSQVNMATSETVTFKVRSDDPFFPGATIKGYQWQAQNAGVTADPDTWSLISTDPSKDYSFSSTGNRVIYARMVDNHDVATRAIPVRVWNRPTIDSAPPSALGSWLDGKYVGVVGQPIELQASGTAESGLSITEFRWYRNQSDTAPLVTQNVGQTAQFTPTTQNFNGTIYVEAMTNLGIRSNRKMFDLVVYPVLSVEMLEPAVRKAGQPVTLDSSVNTQGFPSSSFSYR